MPKYHQTACSHDPPLSIRMLHSEEIKNGGDEVSTPDAVPFEILGRVCFFLEVIANIPPF